MSHSIGQFNLETAVRNGNAMILMAKFQAINAFNHVELFISPRRHLKNIIIQSTNFPTPLADIIINYTPEKSNKSNEIKIISIFNSVLNSSDFRCSIAGAVTVIGAVTTTIVDRNLNFPKITLPILTIQLIKKTNTKNDDIVIMCGLIMLSIITASAATVVFNAQKTLELTSEIAIIPLSAYVIRNSHTSSESIRIMQTMRLLLLAPILLKTLLPTAPEILRNSALIMLISSMIGKKIRCDQTAVCRGSITGLCAAVCIATGLNTSTNELSFVVISSIIGAIATGCFSVVSKTKASHQA